MTFKLRTYQEEMASVFFDLIDKKRYILEVAPCGSGKTIFFNEVSQRYLKLYPHNKIAIITRIGTLVMQTHDKFMAAFPGSVFGVVGIASKKISATVEVDKPITIATIQTLINCQPSKPFDLIIIDEVHQLNTKDKSSQIQRFLNEQEKRNPNLIVLGVTATPYRLGSGFIYGDRVRPGCTNWFEDLDYQITMGELEEQNYLVPHICLEVKNIKPDIKDLPKNNEGDYVSGHLSERMRQKRHVQSAVMAIVNYAKDRKHIAIFCVDIAHAERVKEALRADAITAETVHSKKDEEKNVNAIKSFESGRTRCLVSVESLTTGFDSTCIDCILFLRPTESPALFVQMFGRGKRPHIGKSNCLMLDMAALFRSHGDPNDPEIIVPVKTKRELKEKTEVCQECKFVIYDEILKKHICANKNAKEYRYFVKPDHCCDPSLFQRKPKVRVCDICKSIQQRPFTYNFCQVCGAPFKKLIKKPKPKHKDDNEYYEMGDIDFTKKPVVVAVSDKDIKRHTARSGNSMLKLKLRCQGRTGNSVPISEYFDFYSPPGSLLYKKGAKLFQTFTGKVPKNNEEALQMKSELLSKVPDSVRVIKKNGYWKLVA